MINQGKCLIRIESSIGDRSQLVGSRPAARPPADGLAATWSMAAWCLGEPRRRYDKVSTWQVRTTQTKCAR